MYFGRIHPHKNLDLIIKAFKESNLNDKWKLKIYGIQDDEKYFHELKESLIGSDKQFNLKNLFLRRKNKLY